MQQKMNIENRELLETWWIMLSLIGEQSRYSFRKLEIEFGRKIINRVEEERDEYRRALLQSIIILSNR